MKTVYSVYSKKWDSPQTVYHEYDGDGVFSERFIYFGNINEFVIANIIEQYDDDGRKVNVKTISKTEFLKKFGKGSI